MGHTRSQNHGTRQQCTLWKLMLSSKGTTAPNMVLLLSHVIVFLQTGKRIKAMLNLSVSAAPLAVVTQQPMTWKTARCLYCMNFQVKSPAQMDSHRAITQTRFQLSSKKYATSRYHRRIGLGSTVGISFWLRSLLKLWLFVVTFVDSLGACKSIISRLVSWKPKFQNREFRVTDTEQEMLCREILTWSLVTHLPQCIQCCLGPVPP